MATGSLFAYILFHYKDIYNNSILASRYFQAFIWILIIGHYLFGFPFSESIFFKISLSYIYGLLILQISSADKKLLQLERPVLVYLGSISYGIYMFHMLVDYFLRFMTMKIINYNFSTIILVSLYYILLLFITILISAFSQKYFEKYFLDLKYKLKTIK
jgi:peptidoglycan/LPS O-acetylase OafA/YrhL